jgi:DNA-binding response OmpR family regulator
MAMPAEGLCRVLVVDDDLDLLPYLATSLRELSEFEIITATNGADALERFFAVQPQCVVIDVRMPLLDGYQLVRALRGDPASAMTPLVILTAMVQDKDRFAGLAAGADQYLLKPVKPLELIKAITAAIALDQGERLRRYERLAQEPPPAR